MGLRLCIDPGHGGEGPSKRNLGIVRDALVEKDVTLALAKELKESMPPWVDAWLTREGDESLHLSERGDRSRGADLSVSIHINGHAWVPRFHGFEAYYWHGNMAGRKISQAMAYAAPEPLQRARVVDTYDDPTTDEDNWILNPKAVVGAFPGTAVLVECGYATNPDDLTYLMSDEGRSAIVSGLRTGIVEAAVLVGDPGPTV